MRGCQILLNLKSCHGTIAWICSPKYSAATNFDLGQTAQVSTHFLSEQARKTVAARHVSGNSHGPMGFAARLFPKTPKTKTKNRDSQTKQNTIFHLFCCHYELLVCMLNICRRVQARINTSCSCGSFFFADIFRSFSREL